MRNGQLPIINNLTDAAVASSGAVYTGQYYSASFQTTFGDSTIDGTFSVLNGGTSYVRTLMNISGV